MNRYKKSFYVALDNFKALKMHLIILSCVVIAGITIGVVSGLNIQPSLTKAASNAKILSSLFYGSDKVFFMFFNAILQTCAFTLIIFACNLHIFAMPVNYLFLLYRGYVFGVSIIILIFNIGFIGVIFVVAVFIPIQLILLIFLIIKSAILNDLCVCSRRSGLTPLKNHSLNISVNRVLIVFAGSMVIRVIELILLIIFAQNILLTIK